METKTNAYRGRPKKDFWKLKDKLAAETAENKWKFGRGRPKKERKIDDSINTKIYNSHKEIHGLETKNASIHSNIVSNSDDGENNLNSSDEKISKIILLFSICIFVLCLAWLVISRSRENNNLSFSEINETTTQEDTQWFIQMQVGYNDDSWNFVEMENISINTEEWKIDDEEWKIDDEEWKIDNEDKNRAAKLDEVSNPDTELIKSFYDKINNREFSDLSSLTDRYLRNSDAYRTYFSNNWLNNFLDKIVWNKIMIWWFYESPSDKPTTKKYRYNIKYKLPTSNGTINEEREIAIVDRNGERLIWSIMCITTGCSKMPFFQK